MPSDDELALRAFLRDVARRRPRWGWRRAALAAKAAGWRVNPKRIHRLWIAEGLRVPYRKRKKPLRGIGKAMGPFCPIRPNVVWALDFQFDQTSDGRMLKVLNVIDEFTREALATDVERSIDSRTVSSPASSIWQPRAVRRSSSASTMGPSSSPTRSPTGAASTAPARCSSTRGALGRTPGSRATTGGSATSTSTASSSTRLLEAQVLTEDWRIDYNMNRPHSAHGWLTPVEFVEQWLNRQQLQLASRVAQRSGPGQRHQPPVGFCGRPPSDTTPSDTNKTRLLQPYLSIENV